MTRFGGSTVAAAIAAITAVRVCHAQLPSVPYGPVETGAGVFVSGDYGKQDNKAGGQSGFGASAGLGLSNFGLSASVGALKPSSSVSNASAQVSFAGRLGLKLLGGGLNPVTAGAQVGASYSTTLTHRTTPTVGTDTTHVTAVMPGLWVKISPPLFPLKPWGQVYYVAGSNVTKEARVAVGVNFNLLLGLGVHAGYDWGDKGGAWWGVGAHLNIRVPSLGVPGVPGI